MTTHAGLRLGDLPAPVRARVVALAADALPAVPRLPARLATVADFAPARRVRLGASAIAEALDEDDDLRERVAVQLAPAADPDRGSAEPVEAAARAWLARPEDWHAGLAAALARLAGPAAAPPSDTEPWREKVAAAEQAQRDARARHRAELAQVKDENTQLRRRLGETRKELAEAREASARAAEDAGRARAEAEASLADRDRELRAARARVQALEAAGQQERRAARADRDEVTVRARLLLETVIDAASGLQRELSLPATSGAPGDRVEARLAEEGEGSARTTPALAPLSPAALEQLLALPRSRLVVDGYNVSKSAWPSSSLEAQRSRLVNALAPLVARTRAETTVVFDAAATVARPVVAAPRGVRVLFSPEGVIADDVIRELVAAEPPGRVVVVVTSDRAVARDVVRAGARAVSSPDLVGLLTRTG